jgi:hypothetical protein
MPQVCARRSDPLLEIAMELERVATHDPYFVQRGLYPNVDFYSGIVLRALGVRARPWHRPACRGRRAAPLGRCLAYSRLQCRLCRAVGMLVCALPGMAALMVSTVLL